MTSSYEGAMERKCMNISVSRNIQCRQKQNRTKNINNKEEQQLVRFFILILYYSVFLGLPTRECQSPSGSIRIESLATVATDI